MKKVEIWTVDRTTRTNCKMSPLYEILPRSQGHFLTGFSMSVISVYGQQQIFLNFFCSSMACSVEMWFVGFFLHFLQYADPNMKWIINSLYFSQGAVWTIFVNLRKRKGTKVKWKENMHKMTLHPVEPRNYRTERYSFEKKYLHVKKNLFQISNIYHNYISYQSFKQNCSTQTSFYFV